MTMYTIENQHSEVTKSDKWLTWKLHCCSLSVYFPSQVPGVLTPSGYFTCLVYLILYSLSTCGASMLSGVWLFATPWTVVCQAPLSMGFPRQEYWSRLPFPSPGDLPNLGIKPTSAALAGGTRETPFSYYLCLNSPIFLTFLILYYWFFLFWWLFFCLLYWLLFLIYTFCESSKVPSVAIALVAKTKLS